MNEHAFLFQKFSRYLTVMLAAWLHSQLHSQSCKQVSCENTAVFQILLPLKWQAAFALKNLSNSSIVIVLYFSVVLPFLFLCLAILVYLFA